MGSVTVTYDDELIDKILERVRDESIISGWADTRTATKRHEGDLRIEVWERAVLDALKPGAEYPEPTIIGREFIRNMVDRSFECKKDYEFEIVIAVLSNEVDSSQLGSESLDYAIQAALFGTVNYE